MTQVTDSATTTDAAVYDLVLRGGTLIDPAQGLHGQFDVAIKDGRVAKVAAGLEIGDAGQVIDCAGKLVVPGLVDLHAHFFYGVLSLCRDSRKDFLPTGTTCAVDAGTSGAANYFNLRDLIIGPSDLHLYAFLHIVATGMLAIRYTTLEPQKAAVIDKAVAMIRRNPETIIGVKVQLPGDDGPDARLLLANALEATAQTGTPVMVHIQGGFDIARMATQLRPGDIVTHCFQPHEPTLLGEDGRLRPEVLDAVARGVILDFAPAGTRHFSWRVVRAAGEQGVWPHVISTDYANAPRSAAHGWMRTLPEAMSMMLHAGMPLEEVVRAATQTPAAVIGRGDLHGSLAVGRAADIAVLETVHEDDVYVDREGHEETISNTFRATHTLLAGRVAWQRD